MQVQYQIFLFYFASCKNQQIQYKSLDLNNIVNKLNMKYTVFATIAGLAMAGDSLRSDSNYFSSSSSGATTASGVLGVNSLGNGFQSGFGAGFGSGLSGGLSGFGFGSGFGNGLSLGLGGPSNLAVSTIGALGSGGASLSSATGLSNVGTGAILVTPTNTGSSAIGTGALITDGNYPKADLSVLSGTSSSLINNNVVANNVINNAYLQTQSPTKSIDSLFTRLPTSADIDNMVISADIVGILRTIQAVGTNETLPCDQRIAYLLEILGRVKTVVQKKTFAADSLKIVVDAANKQITRLQNLITINNGEIDKLGTANLKSRQTSLNIDYQAAYNEYNKFNTQIPVVEAQINGVNREIQILISNSDVERNRIANDRLKLTDINAQIASIQNKINALQKQQTTFEGLIRRSEATITDNDNKIAEIRLRVDGFQSEIGRLADRTDTIKSQVRDLQIKANRLRTDISINDAKRAVIIQDNDKLTERIALERKKLVPGQLTALIEMVATLRGFLPNVQAEVDKHYYYCFGEGKVQVKNAGGVVIYIVRGEAFANYLRNVYGANVILPSNLNNNAEVNLRRVDVFGDSWLGAFGNQYGTSAFSGFGINSGSDCSAPSADSIIRGSGTISRIGENYIELTGGQRFGLTPCSRLESTTSLPSVGQQFYYTGYPVDNKEVRLHSGTCF